MIGRSDAEQSREIARDIAIELIRKTGVQEWQDAQKMNQITERAIESARLIVERFPDKTR